MPRNLISTLPKPHTIEDRVNLVESLKRKYGPSIADIFTRQETIAARLDNIDNRSEKIETLAAVLADSRKELDAVARKLTTARKKSAPRLAKEIASQLKELGFKQSSFEVDLAALIEPTPPRARILQFPLRPQSRRTPAPPSSDRIVRRNFPRHAGGEILARRARFHAADGLR